jgi:alkylhydroperoxidase family enzyme
MALVPLVTKDQVYASDLPMLEAGEASFGKFLNTWLAIANCPGMFGAYLPFVRAVSGPGELDQRIKELTGVYVSLLNHCRYSTSHRCFSALANGVSEAELESLAIGEFGRFTDREQLALQLVRVLTVEIATTGRAESATGVDPELLSQVKDSFQPRELVELIMSIALWNALTRFHRVMDFDLDLREPPSLVDAAV